MYRYINKCATPTYKGIGKCHLDQSKVVLNVREWLSS